MAAIASASNAIAYRCAFRFCREKQSSEADEHEDKNRYSFGGGRIMLPYQRPELSHAGPAMSTAISGTASANGG